MVDMIRSMRTVMALGAVLGLASWATAQLLPAEASDEHDEVAYTIPMFQSEQSFDDIGTVKEILVEVGDHVKKGDVLVSLDRRIQEAELERLKIEANSGLRVKAAQAELDLARVTLKNKQEMARNNVASLTEIQEAELNVTVGEYKVQLEEEALLLAKLKLQQQTVKLETMQLKAEFDGIVAKVDVSLGEVVDPDRPAMTVVQNDPLRVQLYLVAEKAAMLKSGEILQARYNSSQPWTDVKIRFISPVASAESGLHLVELELPNPENKAAGLNMMVRLPDRLSAPEPEAAAAR